MKLETSASKKSKQVVNGIDLMKKTFVCMYTAWLNSVMAYRLLHAVTGYLSKGRQSHAVSAAFSRRFVHSVCSTWHTCTIETALCGEYHGQKQKHLSWSDRPLIELSDGTWSLIYSEHRNNTGGWTYSGWNAGLANNLRDGVPVGVYIEYGARASRYYRALAFVEDYNPEYRCFILRGPVTSSIQNPLVEEQCAMDEAGVSIEELLKDARTYKMMRESIREQQPSFRKELLNVYDGACVITGCTVTDVLQAARIIGYRGLATNIVTNGLLLRADVHILYDRGLLTIDPKELRVKTSSRLKSTSYASLDGKNLELPSRREFAPNREYLAVKYQEFELMDRAS